jgi:hypothetical protein
MISASRLGLAGLGEKCCNNQLTRWVQFDLWQSEPHGSLIARPSTRDSARSVNYSLR